MPDQEKCHQCGSTDIGADELGYFVMHCYDCGATWSTDVSDCGGYEYDYDTGTACINGEWVVVDSKLWERWQRP